MEWEPISPDRVRSVGGAAVTIGWRVPAKGLPRASITLGKLAVDQLGVARGQRLAVEHAPSAGLLRILVVTTSGWAPSWKDGCCALLVPLPWVKSQKRFAADADWRIEGGALVLELPAWAKRPPVVTKVAPYQGVTARVADPAAAMRRGSGAVA